MPGLIRFFLGVCFWLAIQSPGQAAERFASLAFHDVVEFRGDLDDDAVTVDQLIGFFEWLKANDWTSISLDDVTAAREGRKPLPERAILLTFDDGMRSSYTRVFPLLLAYRFHAVISLIGSNMEGPMDGTVRYGDRDVPRKTFISWAEAREMESSGLVEIASHSYNLHRALLSNPQKNTQAAGSVRLYRPGKGYESEAEFRNRLTEDLVRSRELLTKHLGKKPRALAWPFGRYNAAGLEVAKEAGFQFTLTLDPEPAQVTKALAIGRYLPSSRTSLSQLVMEIRSENPLPSARRLVAMDPADLWTGDDESMNDRLGKALERLRTLGATAVVLEAGTLDEGGSLLSAWFPNHHLPVRADILSRIARQCQSRAGVKVYLHLPVTAALRTLGAESKVRSLYRELGEFVPMDGMFIDDAPDLAQVQQDRTSSGKPWEVRAARNAIIDKLTGINRLELLAFQEAAYSRPDLQLILLSGPSPFGLPSAIADLTLVPTPLNSGDIKRTTAHLEKSGWLNSDNSRRCGLWMIGGNPPSAEALEAAARAFQRKGGTVYGWANDDPVNDRPNAKKAGRTVSAATFPVKF